VTCAAFGLWSSPLAADLVAGASVRLGGLVLDGDDAYWIESRPREKGRSVLVRWRDGQVTDVLPPESSDDFARSEGGPSASGRERKRRSDRAASAPKEEGKPVSPPFNVRTRVHEYGGGAFAVCDGLIAFVHDGDQRLYLVDGAAAPRPLTPPGSWRFADLEIDRARQRVICVAERARPGQEPENLIAAVSWAGSGEPEVLVRGADFYAFPRLDPRSQRLAYLSWNHPLMPWDGTELVVADLDGAGRPASFTRVAGGKDESLFQPAWSPRGDLHFVSDRSGFWNLYRADGDGVVPLCPIEAEFASPLWVFGLSTYAWADDDRIACVFFRQGTWHLGVLQAGALREISTGLSELSYVRAGKGRIVLVGGSPTQAPAIHRVDLATGALTTLHQPSVCPVPADALSSPQPVDFPSTDGAQAHGLYYPPRNPDQQAPSGELPPLIVISHGGPTAAASSALNLTVQFWTSRGFAVLDVNYRGSTGYGRAYREALRGKWGIADVDDCVAGALYLAERGLVDRNRLAIRGGSAGGFTTLCALVFRDVFRAGASYYGVSDLEMLATDTHKFESRYLDSLVGPYPARRDQYQARSPLHAAERLQRPVIFFQGSEDRVVPPEQARRMVDVLRQRGIAVEYVEFPGEQHGFRRAENISRALQAELAFYQRIFCTTSGQ
jgi:dipeptidyl aminopeptidase/acylaminoacyl peptidase